MHFRPVESVPASETYSCLKRRLMYEDLDEYKDFDTRLLDSQSENLPA